MTGARGETRIWGFKSLCSHPPFRFDRAAGRRGGAEGRPSPPPGAPDGGADPAFVTDSTHKYYLPGPTDTMPEPFDASPERRLENLSRLLDHALADPSVLLAQQFYGEARGSLSSGDFPSARRALALAEMALRFGGHPAPDAPAAARGPPTSGGEGGPEPPPPPVGRLSGRP